MADISQRRAPLGRWRKCPTLSSAQSYDRRIAPDAPTPGDPDTTGCWRWRPAPGPGRSAREDPKRALPLAGPPIGPIYTVLSWALLRQMILWGAACHPDPRWYTVVGCNSWVGVGELKYNRTETHANKAARRP